MLGSLLNRTFFACWAVSQFICFMTQIKSTFLTAFELNEIGWQAVFIDLYWDFYYLDLQNNLHQKSRCILTETLYIFRTWETHIDVWLFFLKQTIKTESDSGVHIKMVFFQAHGSGYWFVQKILCLRYVSHMSHMLFAPSVYWILYKK